MKYIPFLIVLFCCTKINVYEIVIQPDVKEILLDGSKQPPVMDNDTEAKKSRPKVSHIPSKPIESRFAKKSVRELCKSPSHKSELLQKESQER